MAVARVGAYRNSITAANPANATLVADLPQAATAGNLLVLSVYAYSADGNIPTFTPPAGWTAVVAKSGVSGTGYSDDYAVYTKTATAGETTASFTGITCTNGALVVVAVELSGSFGIDTSATARNTATGTTTITASISASSTHDDYVVAFWAMNPNTGQGGSVAQGTWSGGASSAQANTALDPGNQQPVFVASGVGTLAAGSAGSPTYSYSPPSTLNGSAARLGVLAIKSVAAGSGGTGRPVGRLYPTPTQDSGTIYQLSTTASTATSKTAVSVAALGNATQQFVPEQTSSATGGPDTAPATLSKGWRLSPATNSYGDAGTLLAGTLACTVNLTASAALGACTVTVVLFVDGAEIARATSASTTLNANAATAFTASISVPQTTLAAGAKVGVAVWLTAPINTNLSATTVTMNYGTAGTSYNGLRYTIQAVRTTAVTVTMTPSVVRRALLSRTAAVTVTMAPSAARRAAYLRTAAVTVTMQATSAVALGEKILARLSGGATIIRKKIMAVFDD